MHLIPAKGTELVHASWIKPRQRRLILLSYIMWRSDDAQLSSFAKSDNYNYKCLCKRSHFLPSDWQLPSGFACINPFCMQTPQIKKKRKRKCFCKNFGSAAWQELQELICISALFCPTYHKNSE